MVDIFTLALTHALMALAAVRLLMRDDLDQDSVADGGEAKRGKPWLAARGAADEARSAEGSDA